MFPEMEFMGWKHMAGYSDQQPLWNAVDSSFLRGNGTEEARFSWPSHQVPVADTQRQGRDEPSHGP